MKNRVLAVVVIAVISATSVFAGQLTIIKADYTGGDVHRDVTSLVAGMVQGGQLAFRVGNNTLGGTDPCFGKVKTLTVQYQTEGGDFSITAREGDNLQLPSAQAILIAPVVQAVGNSSSNQVLTTAAQPPVPQITLPLTGQEFTTLDGDKYTNVTVRKILPDGIVVADQDGIRTLKFKKLPPEVGAKFGFDTVRASQYEAAEKAAAIAAQKQFVDAERAKQNQLKGDDPKIAKEHFKVTQVLGAGCLVDKLTLQGGRVIASSSASVGGGGGACFFPGTYQTSGHIVYLEGINLSGLAEDQKITVAAHKEGNYTFVDTQGAKRVVEKWVADGKCTLEP